jgi:uncharacterized coiled-coil protein SlyX
LAVRTLALRTALPQLLIELDYTRNRLRTNPLGAPFLPAFDALRAEWDGVFAQELALRAAQTLAQAMIDAADDAIDDFCADHAKAVLAITKDDVSHPLWELFYGKKTLAQFRRPVLGGQLETMRGWIGLLQKSEYPTLAALAPRLIPLVKAADDAVAARAKAEQDNRLFRAVGARKQWIDKLNATRKESFGALGKLPHEQAGLPSDFASRFFRPAPTVTDEDVTVASVKARIGELETELADQGELLKELEAAAAQDAEAQKQVDADRAALAEAEKTMADAAQKAAALKAKLGRRR